MQTTRYEFLDCLRVIAIFVLLFFHTGMLFVGWGWHIENAEVIESLRLQMDLSHRLRMPLLFVIAGAGMWFALRRRSGQAFVGERTLRLLVPAVVGMFLIVPPQVFVERILPDLDADALVTAGGEEILEGHRAASEVDHAPLDELDKPVGHDRRDALCSARSSAR